MHCRVNHAFLHTAASPETGTPRCAADSGEWGAGGWMSALGRVPGGIPLHSSVPAPPPSTTGAGLPSSHVSPLSHTAGFWEETNPDKNLEFQLRKKSPTTLISASPVCPLSLPSLAQGGRTVGSLTWAWPGYRVWFGGPGSFRLSTSLNKKGSKKYFKAPLLKNWAL